MKSAPRWDFATNSIFPDALRKDTEYRLCDTARCFSHETIRQHNLSAPHCFVQTYVRMSALRDTAQAGTQSVRREDADVTLRADESSAPTGFLLAG